MPSKHLETSRSSTKKASYRVLNWSEYETGLRRRGEISFWISCDAVSKWQAPHRKRRGGQAVYSDFAIETVLRLGLVFHQPLRQAEGFARSIVTRSSFKDFDLLYHICFVAFN